MNQPIFHPIAQNIASSSRVKRKNLSEESEDEEMAFEPRRIRSPPLKRRATFPVPELMTDHSASNSDEDVNMDEDPSISAMDTPIEGMNMGFTFGEGGSGGFGFGPGMDEDESDEGSLTQKHYPTINPYPSIQATANLGHLPSLTPLNTATFLQPTPPLQTPFPNLRPSSPLNAQQFSLSLAPPPARLLQPSNAAPLDIGASEVEKARATHGPHCKSIPKLVMSQHGNAEGERSLWTVCGDCGATERAA